MERATTGLAKDDNDVPGQELQRLFGSNFRAARLKAGLSQSDVQQQTGIARETVSRIESGAYNLTLSTMGKLAKIVDRRVKALLDDGSMPSQ